MKYIHKSDNVKVLLYHLVFPSKYRRAVIDEQVDADLKQVCIEIEKRYEIKFLEIGVDKEHLHFLVQLEPAYSVSQLVTMLKSLTAREIFKRCPQVKSNYRVESFGVTVTLPVRLRWENMEIRG